MKVGTKSLLFGVHSFLWHPFTVLIAWIRLYGRPNWKELVCIFIHDWGYWGCPNMDGKEGENHPYKAANLVRKWFRQRKYYYLCLFHSRHLARRIEVRYPGHLGKVIGYGKPSRLCYADKLSIAYDPWWFYLLRAHLSGELAEYRRKAADAECVPITASHKEWFLWIRAKFIEIAMTGNADAVPYMNPERSAK